MMMFNFYTKCEKDDPDAVKVRIGGTRSTVYIRQMTTSDVGRLFEVVGKWYTKEAYTWSPIKNYIQEEAGFISVYARLNMSQSIIAGTEPVLQTSWLIAVEENEMGFKPVFVPFNFEKLDSMLTYMLAYVINNSIRPL